MKKGVFENSYTPKLSKGGWGINRFGNFIVVTDIDLEDMLYLYKFVYEDGERSKVIIGHCRDVDNNYRPWRKGARLLEL